MVILVWSSLYLYCTQADTYTAVGSNALKKALKPRPELYDELLEASRTLPRVPASPSPADGGGVAGELRGRHVTLRELRPKEDAKKLFEACNGSPK